MEGQKSAHPRTIQAVERSYALINLILELDGATLKDIARRSNLTKGTIHTHLATLRKPGFIDKVDDEYHVGLRYLTIGEQVRYNIPVYRAGREYVDQISSESGIHAHLTVEQGGYEYIIYRARGNLPVDTAFQIGSRSYLHTTSTGKAILSGFSDERVRSIIEQYGGLPRETDRTITSKEELMEELATIRSEGVSLADSECVQGVRAVAAPITQNGYVLGAVGLSGPETQLDMGTLVDEFGDLVVEAANYITVEINMNDSIYASK